MRLAISWKWLHMLVEIKSRMVLPNVEEEVIEWKDPREELVQRLLEYKQYKDVASMLEERGRQWQQSYSRLANDLPPRRVDPSDQPIHEVELWDLVSALGRVMREHKVTAARTSSTTKHRFRSTCNRSTPRC